MNLGGRADTICALSRYALIVGESPSSFWEYELSRAYVAFLLIDRETG